MRKIERIFIYLYNYTLLYGDRISKNKKHKKATFSTKKFGDSFGPIFLFWISYKANKPIITGFSQKPYFTHF